MEQSLTVLPPLNSVMSLAALVVQVPVVTVLTCSAFHLFRSTACAWAGTTASSRPTGGVRYDRIAVLLGCGVRAGNSARTPQLLPAAAPETCARGTFIGGHGER